MPDLESSVGVYLSTCRVSALPPTPPPILPLPHTSQPTSPRTSLHTHLITSPTPYLSLTSATTPPPHPLPSYTLTLSSPYLHPHPHISPPPSSPPLLHPSPPHLFPSYPLTSTSTPLTSFSSSPPHPTFKWDIKHTWKYFFRDKAYPLWIS